MDRAGRGNRKTLAEVNEGSFRVDPQAVLLAEKLTEFIPVQTIRPGDIG